MIQRVGMSPAKLDFENVSLLSTSTVFCCQLKFESRKSSFFYIQPFLNDSIEPFF